MIIFIVVLEESKDLFPFTMYKFMSSRESHKKRPNGFVEQAFQTPWKRNMEETRK